MFQKIFGLFLIVIGPIIILKSDWVHRQIGSIDWAEAKLGAGGTKLLIQIVAIFLIFLGMTMLLGFFEGIVGFIFSPLLQRP